MKKLFFSNKLNNKIVVLIKTPFVRTAHAHINLSKEYRRTRLISKSSRRYWR